MLKNKSLFELKQLKSEKEKDIENLVKEIDLAWEKGDKNQATILEFGIDELSDFLDEIDAAMKENFGGIQS